MASAMSRPNQHETEPRDLIFGVCASLVNAVTSGCRHEETGSEGPEWPKVGVIQPVLRPVVEYAYFTGQIQAVDSVQVRARVTGYLQTIGYIPGKYVKKDAVLFEIDPSQYQAEVRHGRGEAAQGQLLKYQRPKRKVGEADAHGALDRMRLGHRPGGRENCRRPSAS